VLVTLDPTGVRRGATTERRPARRRPLAGARVGLVSNGLGRSAELLTRVYEALQKEAQLGAVFTVHKPHRSSPPAPEDWQRLLDEADIVIAGFGGCGSCSTRTVRDAMELEWEGIPSVAVVHQDMLPGVQAMTRLAGMPGYRYVVVDDSRTSICDWDDGAIESTAKSVVGEVLELLTVEPAV
jgi:hypothetical protein